MSSFLSFLTSWLVGSILFWVSPKNFFSEVLHVNGLTTLVWIVSFLVLFLFSFLINKNKVLKFRFSLLRNGVVSLLALAFFSIILYAVLYEPKPENIIFLWQSCFVGTVSSLIAYGELATRYRDEPVGILVCPATMAYICINMASGIFALYLVKDLAPLGSTLKHKHLYEALLAGFGSVSFFRTSLFTLKVSGTDVGIGPSLLLKSVLDCADRSLDRWQAERRGIKIQRLMTNVSFDLAKKALPTTCFTLMTNIDDDLQKNVGEHINQLDEKDLNTEVKNKILGVYLYKLVGDQVLEKALFLLGNSIKTK